MAELDFLSGMPRSQSRIVKTEMNKFRERQRLLQIQEEGNEAAQAIRSQEGKMLVGFVLEIVERRIADFILKDPEAKSALDILSKFGIKIAFARQAAERLASEALRMELEETGAGENL